MLHTPILLPPPSWCGWPPCDAEGAGKAGSGGTETAAPVSWTPHSSPASPVPQQCSTRCAPPAQSWRGRWKNSQSPDPDQTPHLQESRLPGWYLEGKKPVQRWMVAHTDAWTVRRCDGWKIYNPDPKPLVPRLSLSMRRSLSCTPVWLWWEVMVLSLMGFPMMATREGQSCFLRRNDKKRHKELRKTPEFVYDLLKKVHVEVRN